MWQRFGEDPTNPLYAEYGGHHGIDISSPFPGVYSVDDGVVVWAGPLASRPARGRFVIVGHSWGNTHYYHLDGMVVSAGDSVSKGQYLAAWVNHLHFGVQVGEDFKDPDDYLWWVE